MPRPDEGMIHAWLDGELSAGEAERVAQLAAEDPEWAAAVAEARGLVAASSRIVRALDVIPGGVVPAGTRAAGSPAGASAGSRSAHKPRYVVRPWMRMAAGVVLVVGTATVVWTSTANTPQLDELRSVTTTESTEPTQADAPPPVLAQQSGANQVKRSAGSAEPAREALIDSAARQNATVASAGIVAQADSRESDALKRAESERVVAGARSALTERLAEASTKAASPASVPAAPTLAPAAKATAEFRARRADQPAEVGVVGGVAAGVTAAGAAPRDAAALKSAASAAASADAAEAATPKPLEGCWLASTAGKPDSLLHAPRITREAGDTLVLVVAADGRTATVRRAGADAVRGETRFGEAKAIPFVATQVACPRAP